MFSLYNIYFILCNKMKSKFLFLLYIIITANFISTDDDINDKSVISIPKIDSSYFLDSVIEHEPSPKTHKKLHTMDDLPKFLEDSDLSQEEGLCIISKFLISQDSWITRAGGVFDQTNFDGLIDNEPIASPKSLEWNSQRARSAAKLWVIK